MNAVRLLVVLLEVVHSRIADLVLDQLTSQPVCLPFWVIVGPWPLVQVYTNDRYKD